MRFGAICMGAMLAAPFPCRAQALRIMSVDKVDGGPVATKLGARVVNPNSSLHRVWLTVNDGTCPVQIVNAGVRIEQSPQGTYLTYQPFVSSLVAVGPISAVEIRFVLLDFFGEYISTIKDLRVQDVTRAGPFEWLPDLRDYSLEESKKKKRGEAEERPPGVIEAPVDDAARVLTVISFVARARAPGGTVWNFDSKAIADEINKAPGVKVNAAVLAGGAAK